MRVGVVALLALLLVGCGARDDPARSSPQPSRAEVVDEARLGPRLLDLTVRSPAVGTDVKVRLLTPQGWSPRSPGRRWPVLYLLHGCCDSYVSWTRSTRVEQLPALRDVLVVMPDAGPVGFYSNWLGSDEGPAPQWETFHLQELRAILERDYGAGPRRSIAGLSMGGLGAMVYAARPTGEFRGAASFSGVLNPTSDTDLLALFGSYTSDPLAIWGDPRADRAVWERHDPTFLAERLRGVSLFVSGGDGRPGPLDPSGGGLDRIEATTFRESKAFVARLRELRIPVETSFYGPGRHRWPYFERELLRALPHLLAPIVR
jgi:diacylglycerol O-acyltransferase/trehalose O-mycolyltransferase